MRKETLQKLEFFKVIELYNSNYTIKEICELSRLGENTVSTYLHDNGVTIRKAAKREKLRDKPVISTKFGDFEVISEEIKLGSEITGNPEYRNNYWQVQCKCGKISWKSASELKNNRTTQCKSCAGKNQGYVNVINSYYNNLVRNLPRRNKVSQLEFNITPEYLSKLYIDNSICKFTGIDLSIDITLNSSKEQLLSLDRIDSNIGYVEGNVQWVHKDINMMKGILTEEKFIELCKLVAQNNE